MKLSDNWIVGNLQAAFNTWNEKLAEIWQLITTTPEDFRGGTIWGTIVTINEAMEAIGYGLLVLFFAMSIFQSAVSFRDLKRPEFALRHFIRFLLAKVAVGSAMEIMNGIFTVCGGIVQTVMGSIGCQRECTAGDCGRRGGCGISCQYTAVASIIAGKSIYYRLIFYPDFDGIRALFSALSLYCSGTAAFSVLCR